ncbi:MAG: polysaccharide biosynthesis tyrosine autokinase [Gammaproteobacteria bacterium]|nr:polysaccharide biosynthesis tyrosine autokinase [Gammaproteobacteria bacterium]
MSDLSEVPKQQADTESKRLPANKANFQLADLQGLDVHPNELELNLRDYWQIIRQRRWVLIFFFIVVVMTTAIASLMATPTYRASLTLQIERELPKVLQFQDVVPMESALDKDFYQTQYELLRSRTLAKRVIDRLALAEHPHFGQKSDSSLLVEIKALLQGRDESQAPSSDQWVKLFLDKLSIEPIKQSRLVKIAFENTDPVLAADIVNAQAESFIQMNLERRIDASFYAKRFLQERLLQVKVKLEESEQSLVFFARENEIIKIDDKQTVDVQKLNDVTLALTAAVRDRIAAEILYSNTKRAKGHGLSSILESEVIQQLKQTKVLLETDYQENLKIYKPAYPRMMQLKGQIDKIQAEIDKEVAHILAATQVHYEIAQQKEKALSEELNKLKKKVLSMQDSSIEYNILKREVETNRELYEGLLQRMKEVGIAGGVTSNNISVVDSATIPIKKYKPKILLNLILAAFVGFVGGIGLVFLFEHLDDTVKTPEYLEKRLRLPVLGIVPVVQDVEMTKLDYDGQIALFSYHDPRSGLAEAYRSVRTSLLFATAYGAPKVLLFTSPGPGEGKTTSALNVAITFTQTGGQVLIIDTDLRNPSLYKLLQLDNAVGLTNYLAGDAQPIEVSQHTEIENLFVIPSGPLPPNPAELLSGERMLELLKVASEKFDYVILDGPPVLGLADALVLTNLAEATVIVVEAGATRQRQMEGALKRLRTAQGSIVGAIMAKYHDNSSAYGYHQYYYYQREESNNA